MEVQTYCAHKGTITKTGKVALNSVSAKEVNVIKCVKICGNTVLAACI